MRSAPLNKILPLLLLAHACAFSLDGRKQGNFFGAGIGPSLTLYSQELIPPSPLKSVSVPQKNSVGMANQFMIGGGLNESTLLFLSIQYDWFKFENPSQHYNAFNTNTDFGIIQYFTSDTAFMPSPYISGGMGLSGWDRDFFHPNSTPGLGLFLGLGYEFVKHYAIQLNGIYSNPSPVSTPSGYEVHIDSFGFQLNLVALAY